MNVLFEATGRDGERLQVAKLAEAANATALIRVLEAIATELCWQPGKQLSDNQRTALHLAVLVNGNIVGGLQAVAGSASSPLPCRHVWPDIEIEGEDRALHVTILALEEEYRAHSNLFWPLCVELWRWCRQQGIRSILLEATPPTLRVYQRLGWPLAIIGDLRMHWGEPCFLCQMEVEDVERTLMEKAIRSPVYHVLVAQAHRKDESAHC